MNRTRLRKATAVAAVAMMIGMVSGCASAGNANPKRGMGRPMGGRAMMGRPMKGDSDKMEKGEPMTGMGGGMMHRRIVPLEDGGVLVVVGNLMIKYDKDLEQVKKATIEITEDEMQQMMQKMKKRCGMCRKMMKDEMTKTEKDD